MNLCKARSEQNEMEDRGRARNPPAAVWLWGARIWIAMEIPAASLPHPPSSGLTWGGRVLSTFLFTESGTESITSRSFRKFPDSNEATSAGTAAALLQSLLPSASRARLPQVALEMGSVHTSALSNTSQLFPRSLELTQSLLIASCSSMHSSQEPQSS